jgi:hypothetical protein
MSMFKLVTSGSWWLRSKSDSRWNEHGSADVGGFMMPRECQAALDRMKAQFGEPPEDLEWGYMKD